MVAAGYAITCIKTNEGLACLAVVIDLFSRRVVGWSMQSRQTTNVALQGTADGHVETKTGEQGADPLRSGLPVRQHGLGISPETPQPEALDEPARKLP